jgi:ribose transport system substrate-binding protein
VLATADQHADQLAVHGIEYALRIVLEGLDPEDRETPVDLVTAENVK